MSSTCLGIKPLICNEDKDCGHCYCTSLPEYGQCYAGDTGSDWDAAGIKWGACILQETTGFPF